MSKMYYSYEWTDTGAALEVLMLHSPHCHGVGRSSCDPGTRTAGQNCSAGTVQGKLTPLAGLSCCWHWPGPGGGSLPDTRWSGPWSSAPAGVPAHSCRTDTPGSQGSGKWLGSLHRRSCTEALPGDEGAAGLREGDGSQRSLHLSLLCGGGRSCSGSAPQSSPPRPAGCWRGSWRKAGSPPRPQRWRPSGRRWGTAASAGPRDSAGPLGTACRRHGGRAGRGASWWSGWRRTRYVRKMRR